MTTGTKSLLFGVHQFVLHPMTVLAAWLWLYRAWPSWRKQERLAAQYRAEQAKKGTK